VGVVKLVLRDGRVSINEDTFDVSELVLAKDSCWITVNNLSVYVMKTDEGVSVDIYPLGAEDGESLGSTWVLYSEAETDEDQEL